jgi:hypothetical protein
MSSFLIQEYSLDEMQKSIDDISKLVSSTFKVKQKPIPKIDLKPIQNDLKKVVKFTQVKQPTQLKLAKSAKVKTFEQLGNISNEKLIKQISKLVPKQKDYSKDIKLISSQLNKVKQVTPIQQNVDVDLSPINALDKQVKMQFRTLTKTFKTLSKSVDGVLKRKPSVEKQPKVVVKKEIVKQPKPKQDTPKPIEKQPKVVLKKEIVREVIRKVETNVKPIVEKQPKVVNRIVEKKVRQPQVETNVKPIKTDLSGVGKQIEKGFEKTSKLVRSDLKDVKSILMSRESVTIGSIGKLIEKSNKTMDSKLDKLISVVSSMNVGTKTEQVRPSPPSPSSVGFNQLPSI